MKMIQKVFQGMFFNNLKRKIRTGHIGKQDTFDPTPHPPLEMFQKIIRFGDGRFPHFPVFGETFQKVAKKQGWYYQYYQYYLVLNSYVANFSKGLLPKSLNVLKVLGPTNPRI